MDMFNGNDSELKALLNNNLDVLLDEVKTDNPEVLNAIEVLKKHLSKTKFEDWEISTRRRVNQPYIYITLRVLGNHGDGKQYRQFFNISTDKIKHYIDQMELNMVYDKIKSLFVK